MEGVVALHKFCPELVEVVLAVIPALLLSQIEVSRMALIFARSDAVRTASVSTLSFTPTPKCTARTRLCALHHC